MAHCFGGRNGYCRIRQYNVNMAYSSGGNNAVIYARISRDIEGKGLGVERQLEECRALADRRGLTVARELTDNDISAYSGRHRPGYREMLAALEAGGLDVVICWHTDRLHRSPLELEEYISLSERHDVSTLTVESGELDLSTPNGRMTARVHGAVSRHESEHKAKRIRSQKAQAAKDGRFLGGRVPWGWRVDGGVNLLVAGREVTKGGTIIVDDQAADFIRQGTEAILQGHSLIEVTRRWADGGARSLSGTRMNTTQVRRVLTRERNAGIVIHRGQRLSVGWPPIVPLEEFRALQARLDGRDIPRQSAAKFKYLLSGVVRCHCGRWMTGFGAEATEEHPEYRRMYRCRVHAEGGRYVRGHATREMKTLNEYVLEYMAAYVGRPETRQMYLNTKPVSDRGLSTKTDDMDVAAQLEERMNTLSRLHMTGAITEAQLVEGTASFKGQMAELEREAVERGASAGIVSLLTQQDPAKSFLAATTDMKRGLISSMIDIQVLPGAKPGMGFNPELIDIKRKAG
jgi:site-specific DNA recombinase